MQTLDNVLHEINEQEEQQHQEQFDVKDLESATEASRRIAYFADKMKEIDSIVDSQLKPFLEKVEKIREWGEQAKTEYVDKSDHYANLLEHYWRKEITSGRQKKKTLSLPYGKFSLKKQQPSFEKDEPALLDYALERGLVKIADPKTDWAQIKKNCQVVDGKLVDENGETVPGVTVEEREDKFHLELEG
jgi:hypothetical protein